MNSAMRQKRWLGKWAVTVLVATGLAAAVFGDEIVGRLYFRSLCTSQGGAKVSKQVRLSAHLWTADGQPVFLDSKGNKVRSGLDELYAFHSSSSKVSEAFRIDREVQAITDRRSGEEIATYTTFYFFGGWFRNSTSLHVSGTHCPAESGYLENFLLKVFVRA